MRGRLATQRKTLEALIGAISGSIKEARFMMSRMERLNLEAEIAEMQKLSTTATLPKGSRKTVTSTRAGKTTKKKGARK